MLSTALLLANVLSSQQPTPVDSRRLDAIVRTYVSSRQFSGSILIARKDKVLFDRAYGMASWDWRTPNTTSTKFRLGSVTKQFTAACVLLLEERGKLKLTDSILTHFPDGPKAWQGVTVRHLLNHESGIPNITGLPGYSDFERLRHSSEALRQRFSELPLLFEPGTKHRYSNSGYILLGQLIEKVAGEPYEIFLRKNVLEPAGMKETGCDSNTAIVPNRAVGYFAIKDGFAPATYIDMSVPFSAGNMYSTTRDLLRWERALFGGKILSPASFAKMTHPYKGVVPSATGIGMGLAIDETYGRKQIFFGGGIEGFNSWLAYDPADDTIVIALSNVTTPWLEDMSGQLAAVCRGEKVVLTLERKEVRLKEDILRRYVGAYVVSPTMNLNIGLESGNFYIQADGQGRLPLYAEAETRFFLKVLDAQAEFVPNSRGSWDLLWTQGGSTLRAPRK